MSKVVDFGKVQIFKSDPFDWSNDRTYEKLELVRYNGFTYLCIENTYVEGILPTNEDYFILIGFDAGNSNALLAHINNKNNPHNTQSVATAANCTGNSATATKAIQDNNGDSIISTYGTTLAYDSINRKLVLKSKDNTQISSLSLNLLDLLPVGTIIHIAYNVDENGIPGFLPLNGGSYNRTTYNALFKKIGTTYGAANSSTFKVPNGDNRFLMMSSTNIGTYVEAAIPNIKGRAGAIGEEGTNYTTGAFYQDGTGGEGDDSGWDYWVYIDASRSSSVYKDGVNTVQPPAIRVRAFIKY